MHSLWSTASAADLVLLFYTTQAVCFAEFAQHGTAAAGHAVIASIFLFYAAYNCVYTSHRVIHGRDFAVQPLRQGVQHLCLCGVCRAYF